MDERCPETYKPEERHTETSRRHAALFPRSREAPRAGGRRRVIGPDRGGGLAADRNGDQGGSGKNSGMAEEAEGRHVVLAFVEVQRIAQKARRDDD